MKTWVFFILMSAVTGYVDEWNLIHYSKSEDELLKCLENTNLSKVFNDSIEYAQIRTYVVERLAYLMHEVTVPVESIEPVAIDLVNKVKQQSHLLHMQSVSMNNTKDEFKDDLVDVAEELSVEASADTILTFDKDEIERVRQAIMSALHECSDPERPTSNNETWGHDPPRFVQEIPELSELLNMILASPVPFSPGGTERFYLEQSIFCERSLTLIEASLRITNNAHELTYEFTRMWNRRVRLFYDQSYFGYLYSFYKPNRTVVMINPRLVIPFRFNNDSVRDPPATNRDIVFEMTSYRELDWNSPGSSRVFSVPSIPNETMTKSRYRFLWYRYQFLRRLFAYLESVERGLTLKSKPDKWQAYSAEVPIVLRDSAATYKAYLENVQRRELRHKYARNSPDFSSLVRSLRIGDQIDEFDLLMMVWHRLKSDVDTTTTAKNWYQSFRHQLSKFFKAGPSKSRTKTVITANRTTPSYTDSSSTPSYDESKRGKGKVKKLSSGKYVPKKQRGPGENRKNNPSTSKECRYSKNSKDMAENNCKFSANSDNSELSLLTGNDVTRSLKLLRDTFFTLFKSQMHSVGGLNCYSD